MNTIELEVKIGSGNDAKTEEPVLESQNSEQADRVETLMDDSQSLEAFVTSILANKRLAWKIVSAYLNERDLVIAPRSWLEKKLGSLDDRAAEPS